MALMKFILLALTFAATSVESLRRTHPTAAVAPPKPPVAPQAEQSGLSPEQDPKELVRHECEILYSQSAEEAQRCLDRVSRALDLDSAATPLHDRSYVGDNLFGITLHDVDSLMLVAESLRRSDFLQVPFLIHKVARVNEFAKRVSEYPLHLDENFSAFIELVYEYTANLVGLSYEVAEVASKIHDSRATLDHQVPFYNRLLNVPFTATPGVPLAPSLLKTLELEAVLRGRRLEETQGELVSVANAAAASAASSQTLSGLPFDLENSPLAKMDAPQLESLQSLLLSTLDQIEVLKSLPSSDFIHQQPLAAADSVDVDSLVLGRVKETTEGAADAKPQDLTARVA